MSQSDFTSSVETQLKQNFLRDNIISQGYDAEKFSDFLADRKTDGTNIDSWTISELKEVVKKFIDSENSGKKSIVDQHQVHELFGISSKKEAEKSPKPQEAAFDVNKSNPFEVKNEVKLVNEEHIKPELRHSLFSTEEQASRPSPTQPLEGVIQITKMSNTLLTFERDLKIYVGDPEHIKNGFFFDYVQYTIKTSPLGSAVKRRYNDFYWLRETLQKFHPGVFVPPIPKKKRKNRFREDVIRKRMYIFETFLNACLEHPDLKSDKYLYHFLTLDNEDQFANIKTQANELPKVERLENLASHSGQVRLDTSSEYLQYSKSAENYCNQTEYLYKKVRKLTDALVTNIRRSANIVSEISKYFGDLDGITQNFHSKLVVHESNKFEDMHSSLNKMMVEWSKPLFVREKVFDIFKGEQLKKQANIIHRNFLCFYKYTALEDSAIKDMNAARTKFQIEADLAEKELNLKKERLFNSNDVSQWELDEDKARLIPRSTLIDNKTLAFEVMLGKETQEVRYQNNMLAYLNYSTFAEISRGLKSRSVLCRKNFQEFIAKQSEQMSDMQAKWMSILNPEYDYNDDDEEPRHKTSSSFKKSFGTTTSQSAKKSWH